MSQTITAANTTTDPTTTPSVTAVADNDIGNASNLNSPLQPILNFIAWLRAHVAFLNNGGARITNLGTPTTSGDAVVYPVTNAQQSFGTPSASTDVATKGYVDGLTSAKALLVVRANDDGSIAQQSGSLTATLASHSTTGTYTYTIAGITGNAVILITTNWSGLVIMSAYVASTGTLTVTSRTTAAAGVDQRFSFAVFAL